MDNQDNNVTSSGHPLHQMQPQYVPTSVGNWFVTMLLTFIPLIGFIMLIVWAFGGNTEPSKKNWDRAQLIWMIIVIILSIVFGATVITIIAGAASGLF